MKNPMKLLLGITLLVHALPNPVIAAAPVIVVRDKPDKPFEVLYVAYSGQLSEMIVAESAVKKALAKRELTILGFSEDASDASDINDPSVKTRILQRMNSFGKPVAMLVLRKSRVAGTEMTFQFHIINSENGRDVAVGEVMVDTGNQLTLLESPAIMHLTTQTERRSNGAWLRTSPTRSFTTKPKRLPILRRRVGTAPLIAGIVGRFASVA